MLKITYHDATIGDHARVMKIVWDDAESQGGVYGAEITPPEGVENWSIYEAYRTTDACVYVLSEQGD